MNKGVISYSSAAALALLTAPVAAWADTNPDFDDDAKPILKAQPGLIQYVQSHFQVKETGTAKYPGDDDRRPVPPYIFRARPIGSNGGYNLRLLIQPGQPGHILNVVDMNKVKANGPDSAPPHPVSRQTAPPQAPASQAPPPAPAQFQATQPAPPSPASAPAEPSTPAPTTSQPGDPTADTPSGPIMDSGSNSSGQSNLAPPPDPAPPAQ